jgi:hypothetical protein
MDLVGVLVGGILTALGGAVTQWIIYCFSKKRDLIAERKRAYETAMRVTGEFDLSGRVNDDSDLKLSYSLLKLYGSEQAVEAFGKYMKAPNKTEEENKIHRELLFSFENICRKDIGVSE